MKARKMESIDKIRVAAEIRKSGAKTSGYYIDKPETLLRSGMNKRALTLKSAYCV
jgi:hypothetical protein